MITLKCLGSSSSGNCYLLDYNDETLILECGIKISEIKKALDWNLRRISGICVSHIHQDHSKSVKDFKNMGVPMFLPYESESKKPQKMQMGDFAVTALPMLDKEMQTWQHTNGDGTECPCYAFLIEVDGQRVFYVTDTKLCVWNLRKMNLTHMMIGLNYESDMLDKEEYKTYHKLTGHLGLEAAKGIVEANRTDSLVNVILCHLGHDSVDVGKCMGEIQKVAGKADVTVASSGKSWILRAKDECQF